MDAEECRRRVQEAKSQRAFPPSVLYPELTSWKDDMAPLSKLFSRPIYVHRTVDLVDAKCDLLYVRYECAVSTGTCFTTISPAYLQKHLEFLLHFPFVLSKLQVLLHTPNGLSSALATVERRRQSRYYKLYTLFADRVRRRNANADYVSSTPPTCSQYASDNAPPTTQTLTAFWMEFTTIYSPLCKNLMKHLKIRRALRIDHSVKFCKRLKIWTGSGKRDGMANCKMLLLAQNEIGQVDGRCLTRSENNDETEELLKLFGDRVWTKQDPFHVIQRITEKVKSTKRKWLSKELSNALYTVDRKLRLVDEMEKGFLRAVRSVALADVN
ncbi:hypothetical protein PHYSODRAFT_406228, partial [Phytophthora sojae]